MRENDEALAIEQAESLHCFAEDISNEINRRLGGIAVLTHDGQLSYTLEFNTVDGFSLVLMGSETNNGDCFQAMLVFDGFTDLLLSDRRPLDEYKKRLTDLVCAIVGNKIGISEVIKKHSERFIEYRVLDENGEWKSVSVTKKLGGAEAFLLLWKDRENVLYYDLTLKDRQ